MLSGYFLSFVGRTHLFGYYLTSFCDRNVSVEVSDVQRGRVKLGEYGGIFEFHD